MRKKGKGAQWILDRVGLPPGPEQQHDRIGEDLRPGEELARRPTQARSTSKTEPVGGDCAPIPSSARTGTNSK